MRWAMAVVLLLPTAAGQITYDLGLDGPEATDAIVPDVGATDVAVAWTVTCTADASPGGPETEAGKLRWDPPTADAAGLVIDGELEAEVALPDCVTAMETRGTHPFTLRATRDAPGLEAIDVAFRGTLEWESPTSRETAATLDVETSVTYHGRVQAAMATRIQQGGPGETSTFEVNVTNIGNAASRVQVVVEDERVEVPALWPDDALAAGASGVLEVLYHHPEGAGWNNGEATFTLELTPVAADDGTQTGQTVVVNSLARTRGVPALGFPLLAVAAVALAWALRDS